ncbi:MAG: hypothetical protein WB729_02585 [Candidatus Sulfotelmatobacter sp.]
MRKRLAKTGRYTAALLAAIVSCSLAGWAQEGAYERSFAQPKNTVEKVLQQLQPSMSGRLPVLEGFATPNDHPLNSYRRGFYQVVAQVSSTASGATVVRLTTKVTAWYADPVIGHSGYRLLTSNGRLEADLLDQLSDQLAMQPSTAASKRTDQPPSVSSAVPAPANTETSNQKTSASEPSLSAPMPRLPETGGSLSSSLSLSRDLAASAHGDVNTSSAALADSNEKLRSEAASLEEVFKNQAHPKNLVAVKKSGTAVVSTPSLEARTLFLASAHDEFEMLNFNRDWVHVRISGLSRGWIWRDSVELPDAVPDTDAPANPGISPAAELFHVSREETAVFPGDWEPLKGKSVKIVSVEKADENAKDDSSQLKLAFAKSVLDQHYNELSKKSDSLSGIVLIFDSSDGGMIAATFSTLQQWKAGRLSDSALWHQCFFDPPETFGSSGSPGSK